MEAIISTRGSGGRSGWITFAAWAFGVAAVVLLAWGVSMLGREDFLPETGPLASTFDFWGWIAIIWGALLALACGLVLVASPSAKLVGTALATMGTIFWTIALPKFPIISLLTIVVNCLIIYGLNEHYDSA